MKNLKPSFVLLFLCLSISMNAQLKVLSNGNTGIGNSAPSNKLNINYSFNGQYQGLNINSDFFESSMSLSNASTGWIIGNGSWALNGFSIGSTNGPCLTILNNNAFVGIGTYDPQYKLDVNGDIATWGTLQIASDERLKENIKPLTGCLTNLHKINGKQYQKIIKSKIIVTNLMTGAAKNGTSKTIVKEEEFGLIAQEIQKVFPELVKGDSAGMLTVNYIGLIPVLIEAIKEQQGQIETLQTKVVTLETCCNSSKKKSAYVNENEPSQTEVCSLSQNIPNPFSQSTQISYYVVESAQKAMLNIYDMQGTQKKSYQISVRGNGSLTINGFELRAGMYLYSLIVDGKEIDTKKMILTE